MTATLNLLTEIVTARYGFITDADLPALLAHDDGALRHCKVLIRCYEGRKVVMLSEVAEEIKFLEMSGNTVRDVAFTASECERLRQHA